MMNNYSTTETQSFLSMSTLKKQAIGLSLLAVFNLNVSQSVAKEAKITDSLLETFEATVEAAMQTYGVPGAAIAIVEGDEIVYVNGFGWRNVENAEPVTPDTRFLTGSIGKSMTSMMVAALVDEGLLDWKQPVVEIWPFFTLPTQELTQNIQVRHLMQFNAGLGEDLIKGFYDTKIGSFSAEDQLDSLVGLPVVAELGKTFTPNSNVFAAAGFIAALAEDEAAYGDLFNRYEQLMQERLFNPIGMDSALLNVDLPTVGGDYATGYAFNMVTNTLEPLQASNNQSYQGYAPSGAVSAHVKDMARYVITQLNKGIAADGTRVVSVKNLRKTQQPKTEIVDSIVFSTVYPLAQSIHYGTGWVIVEQPNGVKVIGHSGGMEGFVSDMAFIPDADVGIAILTNRNFFDGFLSGTNFIGVVRDSLFELIYNLEPTVAQQRAEQYQQAITQLAILQAITQATFTPDTVAPYLGNYQNGWRVELRDDGTLWVVLQDAHEYQLVLLPDGTFMVSNNALLGTGIIFSVSDNGIIAMTVATTSLTTSAVVTDTVIKLD